MLRITEASVLRLNEGARYLIDAYPVPSVYKGLLKAEMSALRNVMENSGFSNKNEKLKDVAKEIIKNVLQKDMDIYPNFNCLLKSA